jgi:hypothetical protein
MEAKSLRSTLDRLSRGEIDVGQALDTFKRLRYEPGGARYS